jgi:hypothetical protein
MTNITHITRYIGVEGRCSFCNKQIRKEDYCYIAGTGLDDLGNSFISDEDYENEVLFCGTDCIDTSYLSQEAI